MLPAARLLGRDRRVDLVARLWRVYDGCSFASNLGEAFRFRS